MKEVEKMEKFKIVQIGCGKMSKYIMRYVYEKGGVIVGAVDKNKDLIGKDIGFVMEKEDKNVFINDAKDLDKILKETHPDVAIITTMSFLNDIEESIRTCVKNGVNVLTTCEEAFYPENSNPNLYQELDSLAKAFNVTITGCGYQDIFWCNMISSICASTSKITKIKGISSYNVEDYGIALAKAHGAGLTDSEFEKEIGNMNHMDKKTLQNLIDNRAFFPSYMWNVMGALCDKLHLHITDISQELVPVLTDEELTSSTLNMTLKKGDVRGMNACVKASTKENILLEIMCIGKVYTAEEKDINDWTIFGEPTTRTVNEEPNTVMLTCADVVNRIPDVYHMSSGFVPISKYPEPHFLMSLQK